MDRPESVILDIDGTLVDSNYQHTIAWQQAFADHDFKVEAWRIHRCVGMGGDQIIKALLGDPVEDRQGDSIRDAEKERYETLMPQVVPFEGAPELIGALHSRGLIIVLASSAKPEEVKHYLGLLDVEGQYDGYTSSGDVDVTKPEPDLIHAAVEKAGGGTALMVGDSVWDIESANRAGLETIAVLSGGFGAAELSGAGAATVVEGIADVAGAILE